MEITIGRVVLYRLHAQDAEKINRRRTTGSEIARRISANTCKEGMDYAGTATHWPIGAQAHIGNEVKAGDIFPMIVTKVWSPGYVNGQVFLDGNDCFWATSVEEGVEGHYWQWPPRV